jgi:hypothetical protein
VFFMLGSTGYCYRPNTSGPAGGGFGFAHELSSRPKELADPVLADGKHVGGVGSAVLTGDIYREELS